MNSQIVMIDGQPCSSGLAKSIEKDPTLSEKRIEKQTAHRREFMARLRAKIPQSDQRGEGKDRALVQSQESVRYSIAITVYRRRLLDGHDNARSALKPIVDSITESLGFQSDDCTELSWEYFQCQTRGATGTQIIISRL